jgi:hypothetical protein
MDVILVQYDNRMDRALRLLMYYTEEYCLKHGYMYVCPDETYELPTYWIKVALVKKLLETKKRPGKDLVVGWIDSDAVFVRDTSVESIMAMAPGKDFVTCLDPGSKTDMNAGVFFVRYSETTLKLMTEWMSCYIPSRWSKQTDGKWKTEGRWAGPDYEQGSFNERILPKYRETIALFPEKVFANYEPWYNEETIICHFMYSHKRKIWIYNARRHFPELALWLLVGGVLLSYGFRAKK